MYTAFAIQNGLPKLLNLTREGRNTTQPRHNDTTFHTISTTTFEGDWGLSLLLFDVINSFTNTLNLFRRFLWNADVEFFLELHHQFDGVQRIGPQIVHEMSISPNFVFFDTKLFRDDVDDSFLNRSHSRVLPSAISIKNV
jgi:hypothetical protein